MTHLHANVLVPKTDLRIAFRGKLDSLMAQTLLLQCRALSQGLEELAAGLGEVLETERAVLAAEVKGEPLPEIAQALDVLQSHRRPIRGLGRL